MLYETLNVTCPSCDDFSLERYFADFFDDYIVVYFVCEKCGNKFKVIYRAIKDVGYAEGNNA